MPFKWQFSIYANDMRVLLEEKLYEQWKNTSRKQSQNGCGHTKAQCRSKTSCIHCLKDHSGDTCEVLEAEATCVLCSGLHFATSKSYPEQNNKDYDKLYLVIGNESCDLDSAVSSLTYATFLHWRHEQIKSGVCTRDKRSTAEYKDEIFVPVLNVDKDDYDLKTEVVYLLTKNGIMREHLVFRDDPNLSALPTDTRVTLVDHHVLAKRDEPLLPYVVEVIDHRPLDKEAWSWSQNKNIIGHFELVGSCCALIAERINSLAAIVSSADEFFDAYPICAILLHATIILDTVNFLEAANKGTPLDKDIILILEKYTKPKSYRDDRINILDTLTAAKSDVSGLSAAQLLRKDTKVVDDLLVPSLPILVEEFLRRPDTLQATANSLTKSSCSVALLLGMNFSKLERDIAIFSNQNPERAAQLSQYLQSWSTPNFRLVAQTTGVTGFTYFKQQNFQASRKQFIRAVTQFIQSHDKSTG